jgi:hypothetical protein
MKIRSRYFPIILVGLFFVGSECLGRASEKNQTNMQEMTERYEEMGKRLSALEDIEAIKKVQATYVNCLQKGNFDTIEEILAENFVFDIGGTGASAQKMTRAEAGKMYRESVSKTHSGNEGDILVQPIIDLDLDGNKAKGKFVLYFFYYHPKTYQTLYFVQSFLDMDYVKEGGKWKISRFGWIPHIGPSSGPPNEETFLNFLDNAQKTMKEMK